MSRRSLIAFGGAAAVTAVALVLFLRPAAGTRGGAADASAPRVRPLTAASPAAAPTPPAAPSVAASAAARQPRGALPPEAMARSAAEEYRRRARFPRASQPLAAGDPDPLQRDREVSRITQRGPNNEEPALTVYPLLAGFEAPEPAVLYAYLSVEGTRIPARHIRGTILTETLQPIGQVEYRDDGAGGDALADDLLYTAVFEPGADAIAALSRSYLVQVVAATRGDDERRAATSFLYSSPHAQLTGRYRDALAGGSLEVGVELEVAIAGRFHVEATLYSADGSQKVAWAQAASELEPGQHWLTLPFYGLILREQGVEGPYLLRFVALSTTTEMPNAKNRLVEANYRTAPYALAAFTDQPFNDPALLDAAARLERDQAAALGGLDAGS